MKKLLFILTAFLLIFGGANAADNLWEYYDQRGLVLPPVSERPYEDIGIYNALGTPDENTALLLYLEESEGANLGAVLPKVTALYEDSLRFKVSSSATSMTLVSGSDDQSVALSGIYGMIIDEGTSVEEFIICSASGTALTSCSRGVDLTDGKTEISALQQEHRRGSSVKITNYPVLGIMRNILNGDDSIENNLYYETASDLANASSSTLIHKNYADSLAIAGAPTGTENQIGIWMGATSDQTASGTASSTTGAGLIVQNRNASSTPNPTDFPGKYVVVTESNAKINQLFLDLTESFTWTAKNVWTGNASSTGQFGINGDLWVEGTIKKLNGTVSVFEAGETISAGDAVYASSTPTSTMPAVFKAAAGTTSSTLPYIGLAVNDASAMEKVSVQMSGVFTGFSGLITSTPYFLQNATGTIGVVAGDTERVVGMAISSDSLFMDYKVGYQSMSGRVFFGADGNTPAPYGARRVYITVDTTSPEGNTIIELHNPNMLETRNSVEVTDQCIVRGYWYTATSSIHLNAIGCTIEVGAGNFTHAYFFY